MAGYEGVVVDLSNVLRDEKLVQSRKLASWGRWVKLKGEWIRQFGPPERGFRLVADANLRQDLSAGDKVTFDRLASTGSLRISGYADPELIDLAVQLGFPVISRDSFADHMKRPGANSLHLYTWRSRPSGSVDFLRRDVSLPMSAVISFRQDHEQIKRLGLASESPELDYKWFCRHTPCPESLVVVPDMHSGKAKCPSCESFLERGDRWHDPVWIKVLHGNQVVRYFFLEHGDEVVLGRQAANGVEEIAADLPEDEQSRVSRRHLVLRNDAGTLLVTDVSSNGCKVSHADPTGRRRWMPPAPWPQNKEQALRERDRLRLSSTKLVIELSGRQIGRDS